MAVTDSENFLVSMGSLTKRPSRCPRSVETSVAGMTRKFRNLVQHAVVVADGDTVQPALARKRNDLAQAHAAVERPLGMNVQIEPQLHDPLPLLSAQTGSF